MDCGNRREYKGISVSPRIPIARYKRMNRVDTIISHNTRTGDEDAMLAVGILWRLVLLKRFPLVAALRVKTS